MAKKPKCKTQNCFCCVLTWHIIIQQMKNSYLYIRYDTDADNNIWAHEKAKITHIIHIFSIKRYTIKHFSINAMCRTRKWHWCWMPRTMHPNSHPRIHLLKSESWSITSNAMERKKERKKRTETQATWYIKIHSLTQHHQNEQNKYEYNVWFMVDNNTIIY